MTGGAGAFAHKLDPPALHLAAARLGRLLGAGLLSGAECSAALDAAAPRAGPDRNGLRMRLAHTLYDAADAFASARAAAIRSVRRALAPPIAARAPRAVLEAAAAEANRGPGRLPRRALAALVAADVGRALHG